MRVTALLFASLVLFGALSPVALAWPNGPLKAIYIDIGIDWNDPSTTFKSVADAGYNLLILAFMVSGKPYDAQAAWAQITNQQEVASYIHGKNARITVSAGGSTDSPYGSFSGSSYGTTLAKWAVANHLDGVDFDLENFGPGFTGGGLSVNQTIQWVADATNAARSVLGPSGLITHAPQPPYFGTKAGFNDAYGRIYKLAPSIDYLLIQYYNNGKATTYDSIFTSANGGSIIEISKNDSIPLSKLVVGKPVTNSGADGGGVDYYVPPATLRTFFQQASSNLGWNTGVMGWQWHSPSLNKDWISQIYP